MAIKLLVVDDEADIELLFRQRLRRQIKEGLIEVKFVFSGEDALHYLLEPGQPDVALILSDINMPGMSGFELLRKVKELYPELKNHWTLLNSKPDFYNSDDVTSRSSIRTNAPAVHHR